jgi:hypothetical protein
MRDAIYVVGGLAVIAFFIARQRRSERFEQRSLIVPAALAVYGMVLLGHTTRRHPFSASSAVLLTLSAVASIAFGAFRGARSSCSCATGSSGSGRRGPA